MYKLIIFLLYSLISFSSQASDIVSNKSIGMELARDIANETVLACRKASDAGRTER